MTPRERIKIWRNTEELKDGVVDVTRKEIEADTIVRLVHKQCSIIDISKTQVELVLRKYWELISDDT